MLIVFFLWNRSCYILWIAGSLGKMLLVWVSLVLIWAGGGRHGFSCCFDVDLVFLDFRVEGSSYLWLDLSELFVSFWLILKAFLLDSGCFGLLCILTLSCHEKKEITSSIVGGSVCCWWRWLYQLDLESERLMFVSHLDYWLFVFCFFYVVILTLFYSPFALVLFD